MKLSAQARRLRVARHLHETAELAERTARACSSEILQAAELITQAFRRGGKVLLCGNGGSAADCQHMAAEFVGRLTKNLERPGLPALALTTDTSLLTAQANDAGFDGVFERQVRALGRRGDVLVAISTSGESRNLLRAAAAARKQGLSVLTLTGAGGKLRRLATVAVVVPATDTQHIQELHIAIEHIVCGLVEQKLFGAAKRAVRR
jgi:D-sedoheptulose 7-phosphate isomerase